MKPADIIRLKELLPTSLGSGEIREPTAEDPSEKATTPLAAPATPAHLLD